MTAWHVGFVRSIMHGRDGVSGDLLRDEATAGGAEAVQTYGSTGNVLFRAEDGERVCQHLTDVLLPLVGRDTTVIHRTAHDVAALVAADLFSSAPASAAELLVVLSSTELDVAQLRSAVPEGLGLLGVRAGLDAAFWRATSAGAHPHPFVERLTGAPATARSIATIAGVHTRLAAVG